MVWAVACVALLAQAPDAPRPNDTFLPQIESAIAKDASFLSLHRGFLGYLDAHPDIDQAERAWWDVVIEPTTGAAASRFDEALAGDPTATAALDTAYDALARDPTMRENVEALQRVEFTQSDAKDLVSQGLQALRANPDLALRLLSATEELGDLRGPLDEFSAYLRARPALMEELNGLFGGLAGAPLAQTRLRPWYQQLTLNTSAAVAYTGLAQEFLAAPSRFWAWHARELAWAQDAQARNWARHVYRKARRIPGVGAAYEHYLRAVFAHEGARETAERAFSWEHTAALSFPPKLAPPRLAPLVNPGQAGSATKGKAVARPVPITPARPPRPTMPKMPKIEMRKAAPRSSSK